MAMNKGVSLIEILVSLLILALIVGPFTGMFVQSTKVRLTTERQLKAIYIVQSQMERLMSKTCLEAYDFIGESIVDGFYMVTTMAPYSTKEDSSCISIIVKTNQDLNDEIVVLTPSGNTSIILEDRGEILPISIDMDNSHYYIDIDGQIVEGPLSDINLPDLYINMIDKVSSNYLEWIISGDVNPRIYPGENEDWQIFYDREYILVERCSYRDYSLFRAKIEAFEDATLTKSVFKVENIIRLTN